MEQEQRSVAQRAGDAYEATVFSRADLMGAGMTTRKIRKAVDEGRLLHVRRDRYALPSTHPDVIDAVRIGGRLSCLSALMLLGIFVHRCSELHVLITPGSSRLRALNGRPSVLHWTVGTAGAPCLHIASLVDCLAHAIRCQAPREALATLDSVAHHGLVDEAQLREVFAALPARYRPLLALVDPSAGSGPETYMRLILRAMGVAFATQVFIEGVGRVDFVVDGWLIIECDSKQFHEGWEKQVEDRQRDIAAARLGYVTVRPLAKDILAEQVSVRQALEQIIEALGPMLGTGSRAQLSTQTRKAADLLSRRGGGDR